MERGVRREELLESRKKTVWVETPKGKYFLEEIYFGLEGEEGDLKRINGFHLHSSPFFLIFLIFYGCISFLHELIPFSRALDVVFL